MENDMMENNKLIIILNDNHGIIQLPSSNRKSNHNNKRKSFENKYTNCYDNNLVHIIENKEENN